MKTFSEKKFKMIDNYGHNPGIDRVAAR